MFSESAYYLVVGTSTLFPNAGPLGPDQITDDPSQTILVVEGKPLVASGMWTEPMDMDFSKMNGMINDGSGFNLGGLLEGGAAVATCDGRGHFIPDNENSATVMSLITPRGGEPLADDTLD